jgi:hypothetical protein
MRATTSSLSPISNLLAKKSSRHVILQQKVLNKEATRNMHNQFAFYPLVEDMNCGLNITYWKNDAEKTNKSWEQSSKSAKMILYMVFQKQYKVSLRLIMDRKKHTLRETSKYSCSTQSVTNVLIITNRGKKSLSQFFKNLC